MILMKRGVDEAHALAKKLETIVFHHIFSSDLNRAIQTCKIITKGKDPVIDSRIRERNWQNWEGRSKEEFNVNKLDNRKEVESDQSVRDRSVTFLKEIGQAHKGKNLFVVAHGGLMRNVLIRILDLKCDVEDIKARNTSYYTLEYSGSWSLSSE